MTATTDAVIDTTDNVAAPVAEVAAAAKKKLGIGFWIAIAWIVTIIVVALLAPYLPIKSPDTNYVGSDDLGNRLAGPRASPSWDHPFGTDQDGRDVFARTIYGARTSLTVGFSAIIIGFVFGGSLGMVAGFLRGWFDRIVSFMFLVLLSFPALVLAILITALLERSLFTISMTLGVLSIAPIGRLARASTLVFAEREFVTAARTLGAKNGRILLRELLPNVVIPMSALSLLGMAVAIVAEGGLAFLGLSVDDGVTWGKLILIGAGRRTLEQAPWVAFGPIIALVLTVLALNFAGDRLRDYFDIREAAI